MGQELKKFYKENFGSFLNLSLREIEELSMYEQRLLEFTDLFIATNQGTGSSKKDIAARKILRDTLNLVIANSNN